MQKYLKDGWVKSNETTLFQKYPEDGWVIDNEKNCFKRS